MNCLETITRHRIQLQSSWSVLGFAFVIWFVAPADVFAQLTFPGKVAGTVTQAATPVPSSAPSVAPTVQSGQQLVVEARSAISQRDLNTAVSKYRQAASLAPSLPEIVPQVARLRLDLQLAGVPGTALTPGSATATRAPATAIRSPATTAQTQALPAAFAPKAAAPRFTPLPGIDGATPIATAGRQDKKAEALRLMAIGRAALDRGDASTALQYARRVQALNVPAQAFAAGEPRAWQFVLDAESAAKRSGISLSQPTGVVAAAGFAQGSNHPNMVKQVGHTSAPIQTDNPNIQQVQAESYVKPLPADATDAASYGKRLYYAGMDALQAGDKETARIRFSQAWEYESQLDLSIRRQLKDKLSLLQPIRLPKATKDDTPMDRVTSAAQEETQRLIREISSELAKIHERNRTAPLDALDQLFRLRRTVDGANVSEDARRSLGVMVDRALAQQKQYVDANRADIELDLRNKTVKAQMDSENEREYRVDEEISALVDTFNELIEERRFYEAEVVAKQVGELKPGSPIAAQMVHVSRLSTRRLINQEISAGKEEVFNRSMLDVDRMLSEGFNSDLPMEFQDPRSWRDLTNRRLGDRREDTRLSVAEREIKRKLDDKVKLTYRNRPLNEVIEDLSKLSGVPINVDQRALAAVRVTPDAPINLDVPNGIAMGKALNIMLKQHDLAWDLENDVLNITSKEAKRTKVYPVTYRVTDLVTPIPNFTTSYDDGLAGALRAAYQMTSPQTNVQYVPVSGTDLASGASNNLQQNNVMNPSMLGQYSPLGSQNGFGKPGGPMGARGGGSFADFGSLIQLIETTVVPDTWEALGGPSTMAPYPQNLSLVISTTSDVHDQIADLLESLRALQNLQITIEVRFITLSDTFFEQIGVDFDVQFDDNTTNLPAEDAGPGVTIGFDGISGLPTTDLDIRINNNSFGVLPPFGAPDAGAISSVGFAILSDIEAFFFLQAAQGDNRANVMQAPKVTLFDGQFASIQDTVSRPFVTSIIPVVGDFAVAQQPVIVVLNEGTQLNVQGIVSDDKRFVRLTLVPFFSQIGDVDTFTFEGRRTTTTTSRDEGGDTNGDGVVNDDDEVDSASEEDVIEGTTVQLPQFATTTVSTTVSVPDGGTILLGGIKRLSEGRNERGVPMLSKIPYVSRLFRNVAVGREAQSLMLMVTPRIIIQEEEEIAQTGFEVP